MKLVKNHNASIEKNENLNDEQKQAQKLPVLRFHNLRRSHVLPQMQEQAADVMDKE